MQNFTLPTSQTLALGNMDAIKNSANIGNHQLNAAEPNVPFKTLLRQQVKTQKDASQHHATKAKPAETAKDIDENQANTMLAEDAAVNVAAIAQLVGDAKDLLAAANEGDADENASASSAQLATSDNIAPQPLTIGLFADAKATHLMTKNEAGETENATKNMDAIATSTLTNDRMMRRELTATTGETVPSENQSSANPINPAAQNKMPISADKPITSDQINTDHASFQDRLQWASIAAAKPDQEVGLSKGAIKDGIKNTDVAKTADLATGLAMLSHAPSPQSSAAATQAAGLAHPHYIDAYPGKAGWDQAISQKVMWMVGAAEQSATLTLNPPDLGPLQVVVSVRNDMADTTFISDNAEVRQALQDGMANLRDKMAESGIQLGQANVNSGQHSRQAFQPPALNSQSSQQANTNGDVSAPQRVQKSQIIRTNNGLVDTFA